MRSPTTTRRPSWLRGVATAAFWVTVPSALWRVLMITGLLTGTAELRSYELGDRPAAGYAYVFGLSAVQLATGFLVTGLARPWGERVLGRRVPVTPPVVAGLAGGSAVTYLFDVSMVGQLAQGVRPDQGLVSGAPLALMVACYLPILAWGPLTLLATLGYWRRRVGERPGTSSRIGRGVADGPVTPEARRASGR